jgi:Ca2+-binding RTX toxin-like protein
VFFARAPSAKQGLRILRVGTNPLRTRSVTTGAGLYYDAEPAVRPVAGSVTLKKTPFEMSQEPCNKIDGSSGADSPLNGTAKRDCIRGMGGNDVINGQGGDDTMTGGAGRDTLTGQAGDDYYFTQGDGFKDHCSGFGGGVNHAWIDDDLDTYTTPMIIH